jgi:hypothetical protein
MTFRKSEVFARRVTLSQLKAKPTGSRQIKANGSAIQIKRSAIVVE